ncbi:MAG: carboxylesterase/lipase family protein [Terriglobia bacterium]
MLSRTDFGRRHFLKTSALLPAASLAIRSTSARAAVTGSVVETRDGKVEGQTLNGIHVFRGIPYGADTAGRNRFMPPKRPAPWSGVRAATAWGHVAPQKVGSPTEYSQMVQWLNQPGGQSEDCLVLNVWTPGLRSGKRPVLFSIHGGGFTTGTSSNPVFDGSPLAHAGDVVVVTINHRLGVLGYLQLGDVDAEFSQSGVAGMLDCVAALEWVRDNISNFGGDPGNVMIFGQSGGGSKVCHLMAMPSAKGLFHKAAMQSGVALKTGSRETAAAAAGAVMKQLGIGKADVRRMQDLPLEKLIAAQPRQIGPVLDGVAIPRNPFDPDAPAVSAAVPIILGTCLHDSALNITNFALTEAEMKVQARNTFGASAEKVDNIVADYRAVDPHSSPCLLLARITTDRGLRRNAITVAERKQAQMAAPAWMYRLDWPSVPYEGKFGAVHGTDVPLTFDNVDAWPITGKGPQARAMAQRMSAAWIAFATTGNPNARGLPQWPAYTPAQRDTMVFDNNTRVVSNPDGELLALLG